MNSLWDLCTKGAWAPKLTVSTRSQPDEVREHPCSRRCSTPSRPPLWTRTFASGGFSGGWYRNQPWMVDEHIPPTGTEGVMFFLNDDYFELVINENGDFVVHPFQMPTNQFVITSLTYVAGNIICTNPQVQGKFTALTA